MTEEKAHLAGGASRSSGSPSTVEETPLMAGVTRLLRLLVAFYFRLFHRVVVTGEEHVPDHGAVILAPNHQSNYDGMLVGFKVKRPIHPMVAGSYCRAPILGWVLRSLHCIPVDGPRDKTAYGRVLDVLRQQGIAVIFPEGHRSPDGRLMKLQKGAARAALTLGVDIVPVSVLGAYEAWPRHGWLPRWFKPLAVRYHPPIPCRAVPREELKERIDEVNRHLESVLRPAVEAWTEARDGS